MSPQCRHLTWESMNALLQGMTQDSANISCEPERHGSYIGPSIGGTGQTPRRNPLSLLNMALLALILRAAFKNRGSHLKSCGSCILWGCFNYKLNLGSLTACPWVLPTGWNPMRAQPKSSLRAIGAYPQITIPKKPCCWISRFQPLWQCWTVNARALTNWVGGQSRQRKTPNSDIHLPSTPKYQSSK